ncbi:cytochrome ubiquinol oxidase subunit I [Escherichia coli]
MTWVRQVAFRYAPDTNHVTAAQYQAAMRGAIPQVAPVFWSFRIMVGCGSLLLLVMLIALVQTLRGKIERTAGRRKWRSGVCRCRGLRLKPGGL